MQKPLISIVTVTYNLIKAGREATFRQCLESIHNQSYENIEHLVIDGASSDGTLEIIKEYAAKGWIKYISEPDTGIYDAMNKGYRMAKGDYIGILNSDDYYHDLDGIRKIVEELEKSGADYVYSGVMREDQEKEHFEKYTPRFKKLLLGMYIPHPSLFIKRRIFQDNGCYDTSFKIAGDFDFTLRMFLTGKYKGAELKGEFMTFLTGGASEVSIKDTIAEVKKVYQKNYQPLSAKPLDLDEILSLNALPCNVYLALWKMGTVPKDILAQHILQSLQTHKRLFFKHLRFQVKKSPESKTIKFLGLTFKFKRKLTSAKDYRWGVSYSVFDGEELLEASIKSIRPEVDYVNVVYQNISWYGNKGAPRLREFLDRLKEKGLIDEIIFFAPDLKRSPGQNERAKRQVGLQAVRQAGCTYYMPMDCDEFYFTDELSKAKEYIVENNITHSFCPQKHYGATPTLLQLNIHKFNCYVSFFSKLNSRSRLTKNKRIPCHTDPSRTLNHHFKAKYYVLHNVCMHHMSNVRKDIAKKYANTSCADVLFINPNDFMVHSEFAEVKNYFNIKIDGDD